MQRVFVGLFLLIAFASATCAAPFEKEIAQFQASDRTNFPSAGGVLFIGSSSIRLWTSLTKDLPEYPVINRGFGGSEIADSVYYADRIVLPYKPAVVVMYAGGNDINNGKSPETVLNDFKEFVRIVHEALPKTRIAYISIAGNPARWSQVAKVRQANRLIAEHVKSDKRLRFIDVFPRMLGDDGQPRPEIFSDDKLHMNAAGYALWTGIVRDHLRAMDAPRRKS
jgi:lysophospholipase L1-like esterase